LKLHYFKGAETNDDLNINNSTSSEFGIGGMPTNAPAPPPIIGKSQLIIFEVLLLCRIRYKLSYRDVAEYFLFRGFEFTHETVCDREERFFPVFSE
jgi:hypothetical protein